MFDAPYAAAAWQRAHPYIGRHERAVSSGIADGQVLAFNDIFYACFAAGDLIAAPYRPQPKPSHIALHAATAGKMVLAANTGWLAYMVPKFSLGRLCDVENPELLAKTFNPALHEAEAYRLSAAAKRLVEFHRSENFVIQWRQELSRMMGKWEDAPPRDWKWVLTGEDAIKNPMSGEFESVSDPSTTGIFEQQKI